MLAQELLDAMKEVGFPDKIIQTLHLKDAKVAFIKAVNDLVPEGSEEDPGLSVLVLKVYNGIEGEIEGWEFPKAIMNPDRDRTRKSHKPPKPAKVEAIDVITPPAPVGRPAGSRKSKAKYAEEKTPTPSQLRGAAVEYSRVTSVIEALRVGGDRLTILKRADRLYMAHGGGSNIKETEASYIHAMRVLKILKLIEHSYFPSRTMKLKKFFTADSKEYQQLKKLSASSND